MTQTDVFPLKAKHHELFPMTIAKLISKHEIQELHFSLTKGMWKHSRWGYPIRDSSPGAELWLWFQPFKRRYGRQHHFRH